MLFDIALKSDTASGTKTRYVGTLKEEMKACFKDKDYGKDVLDCILLMSVYSSPRMLLDSLHNLEKLPKKVKDFDKQRFKAGMEGFFRQQHLI